MTKKLMLCVVIALLCVIGAAGCGSKEPEPTPTPTPTPTATATPKPSANLDELYNTDKQAYYTQAVTQVAEGNGNTVHKCEYTPGNVLRVELYAPKATKKMQLNNAKISLARLLEIIGPKLDVPLNIDILAPADGVETVVVSADFEPAAVNGQTITEKDFSNIRVYADYWYVRPELQEYD